MMRTETELKEWLKPIEDPEIHLSLVELGLIYSATMNDAGKVDVIMSLTSPGCPLGDFMIDQIKKRLAELPDVTGSDVQIVWEPKWDPKVMASEEAKEALGIW